MTDFQLLRSLTEKHHAGAPGYLKEDHYLKVYASYFEDIRHRDISILELGVHEGGSLLLWRDFFPNATIVGLDRNPAPARLKRLLAEESIFYIQGDQSDVSALQKCLEAAPGGQFDIIIDDASHVGVLAKISFEFLFVSGLKDRGLYFVEDFGAAYTPFFVKDGAMFDPTPKVIDSKIFESHSNGTVGWLKQIVDEVTARKYLDRNKQTRPVAACHFWPNLALIQKA